MLVSAQRSLVALGPPRARVASERKEDPNKRMNWNRSNETFLGLDSLTMTADLDSRGTFYMQGLVPWNGSDVATSRRGNWMT